MHRHSELTGKGDNAVECMSYVEKQPSQECIDEWLLADITKRK